MNQDNSLLGFLQRKSLFNSTNNQNANQRKRTRSKSKQVKQSVIKKFHDLEDIKYDPKLRQTYSEKQINHLSDPNKYELEAQGPQIKYNEARIYEPFQVKSKDIHQTKMKINYYDNSNGRTENKTNTKGTNQNHLWTNVLTYANSFESARVESMQCLDTLSLKLNTEIASLNYKVDEFYNVFIQHLTKELHLLKENIDKVVDNIFREAESVIRAYIRVEEQRLAQEMFVIRDKLQKQYIKVSSMREEITKPDWRKVAGQILSTNLQKNIASLLESAKYVEIKRWDMKDLSGQKLRNLQTQVRSLVKFKD